MPPRPSSQTARLLAGSSRFLWHVVRDSTRKLAEANGPFLASGLAFDLLLYSIPLVLLIISALGHTAIGSERALAEVQGTIKQLLPDVEQVALNGLSAAVADRTVLGLTGLGLLVVFGSTTFGSARFALNVLLDVRRSRSFLRGKGIDILMIAVVSGLFGVTIILNSALGALHAASQRVPLVGHLLDSAWYRVSEWLGTVFIVTLLLLMYRVCPGKVLRLPALWAASLTGTALLEISRWAFGWYVVIAQGTPVIYGALGGLLFYILWLYYSSLVFLYGGAVGWAVERHLRADAPSPHATDR